MIPINSYRQFVAELIAHAKAKAQIEDQIFTRLAVTESQLTNILKDQAGIVVAGNIPGADYSNTPGYFTSTGECLLMVLEKMPEDYQGTEREYDRYAVLQELMVEIVRVLMNHDGFHLFCDKGEVDTSRPLTVEWEYNTYGGFNGLSITFRLKDKDV
ncbi:hypothetical protein SAMN05216354_0361 [Xylanibacter ruminicola]|uniref:Uncharacterized protein n=1 Tax=Xylanibacter ruminicola TaxID=839 RepID=A0A1H5RVL1_XYLRU|nr:hypothetical protein [Xylanibacter ruminicola]SEF42369.1 hypothetical protein SAMN05216354_0361 [Xylanibacter ruminicola]